MRSKEQILENSCSQFGTFLYISGENCVIDGDASAALDAMDEYAKEFCEEFLSWANKKYVYIVGATDDTKDAWFGRVSHEGFPNMPIPNKILFNQFLQEIKQDK